MFGRTFTLALIDILPDSDTPWLRIGRVPLQLPTALRPPLGTPTCATTRIYAAYILRAVRFVKTFPILNVK